MLERRSLRRLLLLCLAFVPLWVFAAPQTDVQCARLQPPLHAICNSLASGDELLPPNVDAYLSAFASAKTRVGGEAVAELDVVRALVAGIPEIASARRILVNALANAAPVPEEALMEALVCPTVLGQGDKCLGRSAYLAGAGSEARAARAAILAAMRRIGRPECSQSKSPCVLVSGSAIGAVVWMHAWFDGLQAVSMELPSCVPGGATERCASALKSRLSAAAGGWLAGATLAEWKNAISCLTPAQQARFAKSTQSWQALRKSAGAGSPDFLSEPKTLVAAARLGDELRSATEPKAIVGCAVKAVRDELKGALAKSAIPFLPTQTAVLHCDDIDVSRGYIDDCTGANEGYLGLRLSFSPPTASAEGPGCATIGSLSLLVGRAENGKFAVIDSGISAIRLPSFCVPAKRLALLPYPRMQAVQLDREAVAASLNLVLPKPIEIDIESVSLGGTNALALNVKSRLRVPGLTQPVPFDLELGEHRNIDPARLFQQLRAPLRDALGKRLGLAVEAVEMFARPSCFSGPAETASPTPGAQLYLCLKQPFKEFATDLSLPARVRLGSDGSASVSFEWDQAPVRRLAAYMSGRLSDMLSPVAGVSVQVNGIALAGDKWRVDLLVDGAAAGALQGFPLMLEGRLRDGDLLRTFKDDLQSRVAQIVNEVRQQAMRAAEQRFITSLQEFVNGGLARQLNIKLQSLKRDPLAAVLEVNIPGLAPALTVEVRQGGDLRAVVIAAIEDQLNHRFSRTTFQPVPAVTISEPRFALASGGGPLLRVSGKFLLSRKPVVSARVSMPLIPLGKPDIDTRDLVLSQLSELFNKLSVAGLKLGDSPDRPTLTFVGMVPVISMPLSATLQLGPDFKLTGGVTIVLRPDADPHIGKVQVGCVGPACWVPAGPGFVIGNPRGAIDLDSPSSFSLMATVTFAPGEGVDRLTRVEGTLDFTPERLRLTGEMYSGEAKFGDTVGEWDFREGTITLDTHTSTYGLPIPPPTINVVLDGRHCILAGGANAGFMGLTQVNLYAGMRVQANPCGGKPSASLQQSRPELSAVIEACKDAGGAPLAACGSGSASILGISGAGVRFAAPIVPPGSPQAQANFDLTVLGNRLHLGAQVRPHFARIETRVLGARLAILVPGLESYSKDQLVDAIKKLLEPSFDLSALTRGDITISLLPEAGSGDGDPSGGARPPGERPADSAASEAAGGARPDKPAGGKEKPGKPAPGTTMTAPGPGPVPALVQISETTTAKGDSVLTTHNGGVAISTTCQGDGAFAPLYVGMMAYVIARENACLLTGDEKLAVVSPSPWDLPYEKIDLPPPPPGPGPGWTGHFSGLYLYTVNTVLPACRPDQCDYENLWLIPKVFGGQDVPVAPAQRTDLAALSDHIVPKSLSERPVLSRLVMVLAEAIAWKRAVRDVTCLQEHAGKCIAATAWVDDQLVLEVNGAIFELLPPVAKRLFTQLCAAGCHRNAAGAEAVRQLLFLLQLGPVEPIDPNNPSVLIATGREADPRAVQPGNILPLAPAAQRLGVFVFPIASVDPAAQFDFAPRDPIDFVRAKIIPRLARQLHGTPAGKWLVKSSGGKEPRYLAAAQTEGADPQVFAAVRRGAGVSLRVRTWGALRATMRHWRELGLLSGPGPASAQALVDILIDPKLNNNGFHVNPLLLFGDGILKEMQ